MSETNVSVRQTVRQNLLKASKDRHLGGISVETNVSKGFSVSLSHTPLIGGETETETIELLWSSTARLVCRPITSRRLQENINIAEDERGVVFSKVPYVKCTEGGKHRPRLVSQQSNHHRRQSTKTISEKKEKTMINKQPVTRIERGALNSHSFLAVDQPPSSRELSQN